MASVMGAYGFSGTSMIVIGGLISGVYFWISTTISAKLIKPYTDAHANFVPSAIPIGIACVLGDALFKGEQKSTEDINLPKSLSWLKDSIIACAVAIFFLNIIFTFIAGPSVGNSNFPERTPWFVYDLIQSLTFGGGIAVILYGVRTDAGRTDPGIYRNRRNDPSGFRTWSGLSDFLWICRNRADVRFCI